jgi:hypothetical protein
MRVGGPVAGAGRAPVACRADLLYRNLLADRLRVPAGAEDSVKARGGDSARSDDISTCSAKLGPPDSPTAVGTFSRLSDGHTASSFTSADSSPTQQQLASMQLAAEATEEELADWEIAEHDLRCVAHPAGVLYAG